MTTRAIASGTVTGVFHAGVTVSDMDEALRFYRDGLGLEVASNSFAGGEHSHRMWGLVPALVRIVVLRIPGSDTLLELSEFEGIERHAASARPCDFGSGHLCLYVDDADALHARVVGLGFGSRAGEVITIPVGQHRGAKVAYLVDADGYNIEVYEPPRLFGD